MPRITKTYKIEILNDQGVWRVHFDWCYLQKLTVDGIIMAIDSMYSGQAFAFRAVCEQDEEVYKTFGIRKFSI